MPDLKALKGPARTAGVANPRKWYQWFEESDTPEERRLLIKLDLLLVLYSTALYWVKSLDQNNINNSYVSGMSDDLGFHKNELVQFQTMYTVGAAVFQLPFMWLFAKVPMNFMIPTLDVAWGFITLAQYKTTSYGQMMAYRFLVGALEASFFPGVHWVLGSWYRKDEIGRRGGIFYLGIPLAGLTAGLLQAAVIKNLEGHLGIRAWQWNFLVCAIITIPIGLLGYIIWPGTPDRGWSLFLTKEDRALAKARLAKAGNGEAPQNPITKAKLKKVFTGWKVYVLTIWNVLFWNVGANSASYLLWLKSVYGKSGPGLVHANQLSATAPGMGLFYVFAVNFGADMFRSQWGAITVANTGNLIGLLILATGKGSRAGKFIAYNLLPFSYAQSSSLYGWSNSILRRDHEERAIVLIVMTVIAQASTAPIGLFTYPTVEGPRFFKGFTFSCCVAVSQIAFTQVVRYLSNREELYYQRLEDAASVDSKSEKSVETEEGVPGPTVEPLPQAGYLSSSKA